MTTFRVTWKQSEGVWSVKESGRKLRNVRTKRQAINIMNRRAQPGDEKVIERKNGTVMSRRTEEETTLINSADDDDSGGGVFGVF
jgi:hypothetical protein